MLRTIPLTKPVTVRAILNVIQECTRFIALVFVLAVKIMPHLLMYSLSKFLYQWFLTCSEVSY